jgi:hypothetical protein
MSHIDLLSLRIINNIDNHNLTKGKKLYELIKLDEYCYKLKAFNYLAFCDNLEYYLKTHDSDLYYMITNEDTELRRNYHNEIEGYTLCENGLLIRSLTKSSPKVLK